jgi:hypothetical protein
MEELGYDFRYPGGPNARLLKRDAWVIIETNLEMPSSSIAEVFCPFEVGQL